MPIVVPTIIVALLLGFGALQELYVPGIQGGGVQPFWVGATGAVLCGLLIAASVALWRRWKGARGFAILAALLFIAFHLYASLPPHRNVGVQAVLLASAYGLAFLVYALRHQRSRPSRGQSG